MPGPCKNWVELICDLPKKRATSLRAFPFSFISLRTLAVPKYLAHRAATLVFHDSAALRAGAAIERLVFEIRIEAGQFQVGLNCLVDGVGVAVKGDKQ